MIKSGPVSQRPVFGSSIRFLVRFPLLVILFALVLSAAADTPLDQQNPDAQYIHIMTIIDRADALRLSGHMDAAKVKYNEARTNLLIFRAHNPLFDPKTVAYRLNEVTTWLELRPAPSKSVAESKATPPPVAKSPVKLLDAGAEPRQVLRLHPTAGDKQTVITTMKMKMTMPTPPPGAAGAASPAMPSIPPITIPMDFTVQSVTPSGDINYTGVMGEAGIVEDTNTPPQVAQALKAMVAKFKGVTLNGTISSRGISKKVEVKTPADADPQLRQFLEGIRGNMEDFQIPLPEDAVGAGAKWELKKPVKSDGLTIEQTADYQLDSATGDHLTAKFTVAAESPATSRVRVNGSGSGTITTDLSKLIPPQSNFDLQTEMSAGGATANGQNPANSMKIDMSISMEAQ